MACLAPAAYASCARLDGDTSGVSPRCYRRDIIPPTTSLLDIEVDGFIDALWAFQSLLHDCCTRREPRARCFDSMALTERRATEWP